MKIAIFNWGNACCFFEGPCKVIRVLIADHIADLFNAVFSLRQQLFCSVEPDLDQILNDGHTHVLLKKPSAIIFAKPDVLCDLFERQFFFIVFLQIFADKLDFRWHLIADSI